MKAIILAGGYGTRLFPISLRTPKPLIPVAGKPVMQHIVELLVSSGNREIIVSLKKNQEKIQQYFADGKEFGAKMSYVYEDNLPDDQKLGSVGALNYVFCHIPEIPKECIVIGADNFIVGLDLKKMQEHHRKKKAEATMALFTLQNKNDVENFGIAELDATTGRIVKFQEKPRIHEAISNLASTAVYHLEEGFVKEHLANYCNIKEKKGEKADRIGDLWQHFVKDLHFSGYPFEGIWGDIGNIESYIETNKQGMQFMEKKIEGKIPKSATNLEKIVIGKDVKIAESAVLNEPVIIEEGCVIGEEAKIGPNTHLMRNSEVGAKSEITGSIIFERVKIGSDAKIENSVIDGEAEIGAHTQIENYSAIGFRASIGKNCKLFPRTKIYPFLKMADSSTAEGEMISDYKLRQKELEGSSYWL